MNLNDCYNFEDFRKLAKKKLPSPIFHYIDGGSDDEVTLNRNTEAFNDCDLIPNILSDVGKIDSKWDSIELDGDSCVELVFVKELSCWVITSSDGLKNS